MKKINVEIRHRRLGNWNFFLTRSKLSAILIGEVTFLKNLVGTVANFLSVLAYIPNI